VGVPEVALCMCCA